MNSSHSLFEQKDAKYWKSVLEAPQDPTTVALIIKSLQTDNVLCKLFPRKGSWFNTVRYTMNVKPKELRTVLVIGSRKVNSFQQ